MATRRRSRDVVESGAGTGMPMATATAAHVFEDHRRFLWRLSYRLTGNAADADDIVQETFVRALTRPPADPTREWRPWLVRVSVNLGRDLLRTRRRRGYEGAWLPSPVEDEPPSHEPASPRGNPGTQYDLLESVSFAFLLALEALTPMQRAVLLLCDVFDYSARETSAALGITEVNARTTHLRARRAMHAYETSRPAPVADRAALIQRALDQFLACVSAGDVAGVEALLAADVRALTDAGGEFHANVRDVVSPAHVAAMFIGLARRSSAAVRVLPLMCNGQPAYLVERLPMEGFAPRFLMTADVDTEGRLTRIYSVLATTKLALLGVG